MIEFSDDPETSLRELQSEIRRIVDQVNNGAIVYPINDVVFADTSEKAIAHFLRFPPRAATLVPHAGFGWRKTRAADATFVYFAVSSPMTCDVLVFP